MRENLKKRLQNEMGFSAQDASNRVKLHDIKNA
jgi:hypothetical protein